MNAFQVFLRYIRHANEVYALRPARRDAAIQHFADLYIAGASKEMPEAPREYWLESLQYAVNQNIPTNPPVLI